MPTAQGTGYAAKAARKWHLLRYTVASEIDDMDQGSNVIYRIDASDRIVAVNEAWNTFARANSGEHLLEQSVLGACLWDFIGDPTTRDLYESLVIRVRQYERPVQFTIRCDSPDRRRLLQMKITPQPERNVRFCATPLSIQKRPPVTLFKHDHPRSQATILICGWCKKLPGNDGSWQEIEDAVKATDWFHDSPLPALSHGICPTCLAAVTELLNDPLSGKNDVALAGD